MGYPNSGRPKRKVFDPTSPEPITDECVFCKTVVSRKVLNKPETVCNDCHRPTCPNCIEDLKQTGLWGCWYCSTVDIDERNPEIQKELEKIKEEKLKARRQPTEHHRVEPIVSVSSSSTPIWPDNRAWERMTAVDTSDEYPYRDPPNILDREEGWGAAPLDMESEDVEPGDLLVASDKKFGVVEKAQLKEQAQRGTGRTVQRVKSVFGHFIDGSVGPRKDFDSRRLLYLVDNAREAKRVNRIMTQEWEYGFYRKLEAPVLVGIKNRTDIMPIKVALTSGTIGKHYTLVIADITYAAMAQDGKKINKMLQELGAPVIGDVIKG